MKIKTKMEGNLNTLFGRVHSPLWRTATEERDTLDRAELLDEFVSRNQKNVFAFSKHMIC